MLNIYATTLASNKAKIIAIGISLAGLSYIAFKEYKTYKKVQKRKKYPKDIVILHQPVRGIRAPSLSQFCLKLETWLRITKIPYINDFSLETSSKGKIPWISLITDTEDIDLGDSEFIMEYLSKRFNKNLNENFSAKENALAHAVLKMNEESFNWALSLHRYIYRVNEDESGMSNFIAKLIRGKVKTGAFYQGYGRHSQDEVESIGKRDLKSINDLIGSNKFLLGDKICNEDASLFGMLCQVIYHSRGVYYDYIQTECPNILRYVETMKNEFWKDWDENVSGRILTI